jgi:anti-sigma B factor antagonist
VADDPFEERRARAGSRRPFAVHVASVDGTAFVEVRGDLDAATCDQLRGRLMEVVSAGTDAVVIDCARLAFIDSSGLGVLVETHKQLVERGATTPLTIRNASASVRALFGITGLDGLIDVEL